MASGGRVPAEVVWPAEMRAIEGILQARPMRENRNWYPGESVARLVGENIEHGLGIGREPPWLKALKNGRPHRASPTGEGG